MLGKNLVLGLVALLFSMFGAMPASAAEGQCTELLTTVCIGCHNIDRVCDSIGGPAKKWHAILEWMIANGAELSDDEISLLTNCLTEPYEEAKKVCGK